jgi:hypothetical protein
MVSQFYEEEEATLFEMRMRKQVCYSLVGWFNCLELEVRKSAISSQLYAFLGDIAV